MGTHSSANARYSAMMDLLVPRPRGWITIATVALVLLLPVALALPQDTEETIDEEALPQARVVGQAGYAYQGKADIDGGGDLRVHRFDVGLLGRADLLERLRWTNTFFFSVNDYDFGGGGFSTGDPWETILTMRLVTKLKYQLSEHWGVFGGGVFISASETGADWGDSFSGGGLVGVDFRHSKSLFVSLGVAVITQIADDARVTPMVSLNWLPSRALGGSRRGRSGQRRGRGRRRGGISSRQAGGARARPALQPAPLPAGRLGPGT